jgi:hypothetical protein
VHYCSFLSCQLLDEFTDVSDGEKRFFRMWNEFIWGFPRLKISQQVMPSLCRRFVQENAAALCESGLEEAFTCHLTNLWDEGLLSQTDLLEFMKIMYN